MKETCYSTQISEQLFDQQQVSKNSNSQNPHQWAAPSTQTEQILFTIHYQRCLCQPRVSHINTHQHTFMEIHFQTQNVLKQKQHYTHGTHILPSFFTYLKLEKLICQIKKYYITIMVVLLFLRTIKGVGMSTSPNSTSKNVKIARLDVVIEIRILTPSRVRMSLMVICYFFYLKNGSILLLIYFI